MNTLRTRGPRFARVRVRPAATSRLWSSIRNAQTGARDVVQLGAIQPQRTRHGAQRQIGLLGFRGIEPPDQLDLTRRGVADLEHQVFSLLVTRMVLP